ncbi:MAG: ArsR family transcriptional regulator [Verrucomicrobiales bacterium]|nr:ArsR family transcriptional regulator [Verrucomicrobiales bacterium]
MKKILVVEDHKDSCLWIAAVLRQCGFDSLEAGDGAVAVRMAHSEKPNLILLDLHLPAGGGEFVMESLAGHPETASIPIVIMTGDPDVDRVQMKSMGAVEVFCKPMDVHAFLNTIRRALEPRAATPEPAATDASGTMGERSVGDERSGPGVASSTDLLPA